MAIGMVGVAAIFPAAAKLQDDASTEIEAEQVARNAEAMIKARGIRVGPTGLRADATWNGNTAAPNAADNSPFAWTAAPMTWSSGAPCFSLRDRSYPSSLFNSTASGVAQVNRCDFFWVPLIRDADPRLGRSEPQAAVFVMHRASAPPSSPLVGTAINASDLVNGVPVPGVYQTTSMSMTTNNSMQIGDLALAGPVAFGALQFQWTYASNSPAYVANGPVPEVKLTDTPAINGPSYNREDPSAYTSSLFGAASPCVQVGTPGVTYRIILVSGDLLLEK
jgi:hypothetical protein